MMRSYKDIKYSLRRSNRKTTSIYVERDGQVSVLVPEQFSVSKIDEVIEKKRYWIYKHLAEWHDLNAARVEREYVNGEGFLYLGRSYRLKLVKRQAEPLLLKNGYFCLRSDARSKSNPDEVFKDFYRKKRQEENRGSCRVLPSQDGRHTKGRSRDGAEESLGLMLGHRQPEFPLEVHDGTADHSGLHRCA